MLNLERSDGPKQNHLLSLLRRVGTVGVELWPADGRTKSPSFRCIPRPLHGDLV